MIRKEKLFLPRTFYASITFLIVWMWLLTGIRSIQRGNNEWIAYLLVIIDVFVLIAGIIGIYKLENKQIERDRIIPALVIFVGFGIVTLYNLLRPRYSVTADVDFERTHSIISLIIILTTPATKVVGFYLLPSHQIKSSFLIAIPFKSIQFS